MMGVMAECVRNPEIRQQVKRQGILNKCVRRLDNDAEETAPSRRQVGGAQDGGEIVTIRNHVALVGALNRKLK